LSIYDSDIKNCIEVLRDGGVILYPTDTVWGLGCDPTNEKAVEKLYNLKENFDSRQMLILVDNVSRIHSYVSEFPELAYQLIDYADSPLTIIYDSAKNLAKNIIANDGSIGIRVSNDEFNKNLIFRFRKPIASTSANIHGKPTPLNYSEITEDIIKKADYVVNYRRDDTTKSQSSKIIKLKNSGEIRIIR